VTAANEPEGDDCRHRLGVATSCRDAFRRELQTGHCERRKGAVEDCRHLTPALGERSARKHRQRHVTTRRCTEFGRRAPHVHGLRPLVSAGAIVFTMFVPCSGTTTGRGRGSAVSAVGLPEGMCLAARRVGISAPLLLFEEMG
jgi:hypothetical protein